MYTFSTTFFHFSPMHSLFSRVFGAAVFQAWKSNKKIKTRRSNTENGVVFAPTHSSVKKYR
jgi:hypothetical protein